MRTYYGKKHPLLELLLSNRASLGLSTEIEKYSEISSNMRTFIHTNSFKFLYIVIVHLRRVKIINW